MTVTVERLRHCAGGSYLLLGFKQEVTWYSLCCRKISSAWFWGWTEGHNSICTFSCSSGPCACLCCIFQEALVTRSHSILFIYLLIACFPNWNANSPKAGICLYRIAVSPAPPWCPVSHRCSARIYSQIECLSQFLKSKCVIAFPQNLIIDYRRKK